MKWLVSAFIICFSVLHAQDYDIVRKNYQKAVSDKKICKEMLKHFENKSNTGLDLAYQGAFQAVWAKHAIDPFEKLTTFRKKILNPNSGCDVTLRNTPKALREKARL